jgi:hypothetical protein
MISARPSVLLNLTVNLHLLTLQQANVSHLLQVAGEDHHREGTNPVVFTEIKEVHAALPRLDTQHLARHACGPADVFCSFREGEAVAASERWEEHEQDQRREETSQQAEDADVRLLL